MSALTISRMLLMFLPLVNFGPIPGGKLTFAHIFSFLLFVLWGFRDRLRLGHPSFAFAFAFLLLVASNVLLGIIGHSSPSQITQLVNYSFMMIIMVVAYTLTMRREIHPQQMLEEYFYVGVAYAGISLILYVYGTFNGAFLYAVTEFFNLANTFDRGGLMVELTESALPRVTGLSPEPSFWSIYLCTVLAVGLWLGLKPWAWSMLLVVSTVGLTLARTGTVVLAMMVLYQLYRRAPLVLVWGLGLLVAAVLAFADFDISGADISITQRLGSIVDGWKAFESAPFFGLGWGGFKEYSQVNRLDYPLIFNYYLQVAVEGGGVALALLLAFLGSLFVYVPRNARVVLLAICTAWFSAPAYNLPYVWFLFGAMLAVQRREATVALSCNCQPAFR